MTTKIDGLPPAARPAETQATAVPSRAGADRSEPIGASAAADNMRLTGDAAGLQALERELGAAPAGIDVARVNQVRAALADGSYRIDPQEIANRLLVLERELSR
jgi:negative regulator of flagellin synthesis FlgM